MVRGTRRVTRTDTSFPYTTLFRSCRRTAEGPAPCRRGGAGSRCAESRSAPVPQGGRRARDRQRPCPVHHRSEGCDNSRRRGSRAAIPAVPAEPGELRKGPRSEEHTSELQSLMRSSYAVFCLKKKKKK